ncbi:MAG TPA: PASTA domain-containing protein [Nitrospinota bacterium]|nr:PASTA domain-containing protein [Nitrospinota bacterium]
MFCLAGVFLTGPLFETLARAQGGLVIIPRVVGQPLAAAQSVLRARGLTSRVTGTITTGDRSRNNQVARQSP